MQPARNLREQARAAVIRANHRRQLTIPGNPVFYEALTPEGVESVAMYRVLAAPGQSTGEEALRHRGDENLLVLAGQVELEVDGMTYTLGPGDSIFIPRDHPHRLTNTGTELAESVFVLSPPQY